MSTYNCLDCGKETLTRKHRAGNKYCSIQCQNNYQYKQRLEEWKKTGITNTVNCPNFLKRHVLEEQGGKCAGCNNHEWRGKPLVLEIEHKNGNSDDNSRENLEMLCPNCHSQTPTYKGANKGNGRHIRRERYKIGKSY